MVSGTEIKLIQAAIPELASNIECYRQSQHMEIAILI